MIVIRRWAWEEDMVLKMNDQQILHYLRNPANTDEDHRREIRLQAADKIEALLGLNKELRLSHGRIYEAESEQIMRPLREKIAELERQIEVGKQMYAQALRERL